jgi:hypothetical protein
MPDPAKPDVVEPDGVEPVSVDSGDRGAWFDRCSTM